LIPVHSRRPLPVSLGVLLRRLPPGWVDDGLSCFPDSILGWDIGPAGSGHDAYYCSRMWPAGRMDDAHKREGDARLRDWVWELLPFGLRMIGYVIFLGVWRGGYGPGRYDTCGRKPEGATAEQRSAGLCRHGLSTADWQSHSRGVWIERDA
jgi:hypothetical protein